MLLLKMAASRAKRLPWLVVGIVGLVIVDLFVRLLLVTKRVSLIVNTNSDGHYEEDQSRWLLCREVR